MQLHTWITINYLLTFQTALILAFGQKVIIRKLEKQMSNKNNIIPFVNYGYTYIDETKLFFNRNTLLTK